MSINLSVYVGPYLKCTPPGGPENLPNKIRDLLGESGIRMFDAYGPNIQMKNITRQLVFERLQQNEVVDITSIVREMALFGAEFCHEMLEIRGDYQSVEVCWGVVPGWH